MLFLYQGKWCSEQINKPFGKFFVYFLRGLLKGVKINFSYTGKKLKFCIEYTNMFFLRKAGAALGQRFSMSTDLYDMKVL